MQFLFKGIVNVTTKAQCATNAMCMSTSYKGWKASAFRLVPAKFYDPVITGRAPIYKVQNPAAAGNWGIFVTRKSRSIVVEFKKIPSTVWSTVSGWVKAIVGYMIDTVKELFDFFKNILACGGADLILDGLAAYASGGATLPASIKAKANQAGVTDQDIEKLKNKATSTLAGAVGEKITASFCPPAGRPPPPAVAQGLPGWVLPVGLAGGAMALVYLLR